MDKHSGKFRSCRLPLLTSPSPLCVGLYSSVKIQASRDALRQLPRFSSLITSSWNTHPAPRQNLHFYFYTFGFNCWVQGFTSHHFRQLSFLSVPFDRVICFSVAFNDAYNLISIFTSSPFVVPSCIPRSSLEGHYRAACTSLHGLASDASECHEHLPVKSPWIQHSSNEPKPQKWRCCTANKASRATPSRLVMIVMRLQRWEALLCQSDGMAMLFSPLSISLFLDILLHTHKTGI